MAGKVIDALIALGYLVQIDIDDRGCDIRILTHLHTVGTASADTFPHALALAACEVLEEEKDRG